MAEGNGVDLASIYGLLAHVSETVTRLDRRMSGLEGRMANLEGQVAGLRETVTAYHASVMGHGILISELEERVRRIERRLDMGAPS